MSEEQFELRFDLKTIMQKIFKYKYLLSILLIYYVTHLINLTKLPIFNDESIYLDWGWFHTHTPGHLYDAMLDAKQPLMIWIFGIFQRFFPDPLFAGRFASVFFGSLTLVGVYFIAKKIFNEKAAIFASITFMVIPIFVFFNRQALLEAGVAFAAIWSFYALINFIEKPSNKTAIILGVILGIGFFIKTTVVIYIIISLLIILIIFLKKKNKIEDLFKYISIIIGSIIAVIFLVLLNPVFWEQLSTNSRYSLTLKEILAFPITSWFGNITGFFEIAIVFVCPLIFISAVVGLVLIAKDKSLYKIIFLAFFLSALIFEIFVTRSQAMRYLMSFLPFLAISAGFIFSELWNRKINGKVIVVVCLASSVMLSAFLIIYPKEYIYQMSRISRYSDTFYIYGQTSGEGINEVVKFINETSSKTTLNMVFISLNIGNPESAINLYTFKSKNLVSLHMDSSFFPGIEQYECLTSEIPTFFVTRDQQQGGMNKYFELLKSFPNGGYSVNIYTLKKVCKGNSLSISELYRNSINAALELK